MKIRKALTTLLFFLFIAQAYSQISLCDSIFTQLKNEKVNPEAQSLILNGLNAFPYNIKVSFNSETENAPDLSLVFFQEDAEKHMDIIKELISYINKSEINYNIKLLFAYGERQIIHKEGMVYGSEIYAQSLNSNHDNTVIICDLEANNTKIISSSRKIITPSYLTQMACNAFLHSGLGKEVPNYYVSQLYSYNFFYDRNLSIFLEREVPCIKLSFTNSVKKENLINSIQYMLTAFSQLTNREWDHHFLMIKAFNNYFRLRESTTIKIIILIIFIWLFFIFLLVFVNIRQKRNTWHAIKHIWYSIPVTYFLIVISFFMGRLFFNLFLHPESEAKKIMYLFCFQFVITIFICAAFYTITLLLNTKFGEKSIDYLLIFSCFANQSLFILVDVSLFPIFLFICLLSILAFIIKKNALHIAIFFLMILTFIPYITSLLSNANINELRLFLLTSNTMPFYMACLLYPLALIYFRILTSISRNANKKLTFFIAHTSFFVILLIFLPIIASSGAKRIDKANPQEKIIFEKANNNQVIKVDYEDNQIFDDIIRTIKINIEGELLQCDVRLHSSAHSPLLYTDNDYIAVSSTTGYFKLPSNPPHELTFTYGTDKRPSSLTVTGFFKSDKENSYCMVSRVIELEAEE
ncbi:MAG: hypothetical protein K5681_03350 [Treponema sp.]|nr:hypothetical protein [Treponema sp.]